MATVYFSLDKEHHEAVRKAIYYYYTKLEWATDLNESGRTTYPRKEHIKKSVRIPAAIHKPDKENIQPVGMQFNIKENPSNHTGHTKPNEKSIMDLLCNIMNRLEIIESNQKGAVRPYRS
ncbi:11508_t:CDS:2 [Gigaspora margarita]|uniref:11508_t:CDS:1 n=1 Tax=Gigaspora margarita TaxID=4874 RepID=A0ABN7URC7_GIGMA|nr:11508_t:CDS:2 [Gigaspora margarita]